MSDTSIDRLQAWIGGALKSAALCDSADAGTQPADTGARAAENTADVKATVPGQSVDAAAPATQNAAGGDNTPSNSIGTVKKPTGEDPKNETASASLTQLDPGTEHPAKAGSVAELKKLAASILADTAVAQAATPAPAAPAPVVAKTAAAPVAPAVTPAAPAAPVTPVAPAAGAAEKSAMLEDIVKNAMASADSVAEYLLSFQKASEGEIPPELQAALAGGGAEGALPAGAEAGAVPAEGGGEEPQLTEEELAALAQLLAEVSNGGGGEAGGEPAAPPAEVPPPAEEPPPAPPAEEKMAALKLAVSKLSKSKKVAFIERVLKALTPDANKVK